jgi:hypothetical protein
MDIFGDLHNLTWPSAAGHLPQILGGVLDSSSVFEVGDHVSGKKTDQE